MAQPVSDQQEVPHATLRRRQKADRREALLRAARPLIAKQGYLGVRLEDLGGAAGISGPAVYRHFASKDAVLAELLIGISDRLLVGGRQIQAESPRPVDALRALVDWQVDFALTEPELILIYDRDRYNLAVDALAYVRRTQRQYVEIWVDTIGRAVTAGAVDLDRTRAHAVIGLINSTPRNPKTVSTEQTRRVVTAMALGALGVGG